MNRLAHPFPIVINVMLAVCFASAAYLQANDADPKTYYHPSVADAWTWFAFYGFIAALFAISCFRAVPKFALLLAAIFCLVELARTGPGFFGTLGTDAFDLSQTQMSAARPNVELSREFLGALIALFAVAFLYWQRSFKRRRENASARGVSVSLR